MDQENIDQEKLFADADTEEDSAEDGFVHALWDMMDDGLRRATLIQPSRSEETRWHRDCVTVQPGLRFRASVRLDGNRLPQYIYNFGIAIALLDACITLVADPDFLPEVAFDPSANYQVGPGVCRQRFVDYTTAKAAETLLPLPNVTEDDQRLNLSDHLFGMALYFLALHEQGHFFLGHVLYARQNSLIEEGEWLEMEDEAKKPVSSLSPSVHRSFELQADRFAFDNLFVIGSRLTGEGEANPEGFEAIETLDEWLVLAALGGLIVCSIFEINDRSLQTAPEQRQHPGAATRTIVLIQALRQAMLDFVDEPDTADAILAHVVTNAQRIYALLGVSPLAEQAMQAWMAQLRSEHPESDHPELIEYQEAVTVQQEWRDTLLPYEQQAYRMFGVERNQE